MSTLVACSDCAREISARARTCPHCGVPRDPHKTPREAYWSATGLGLLDLTPGVRDLPYPVRFLIMLVCVTAMIGVAFTAAAYLIIWFGL